ncbi:hypothetical protein psal_cds_85 [Pandoravirus salinus]|uniref:Ankyrin repeat domain containing protein n=1 Tax=Pandoravirus salinus TaxID=1349410 RepID=S4VVS6_9VIRU|nr:hypothetical protein psal_cds_85 [Pandoravirus salinus]AGO83506.1 hypothetical protein psal_cds_85 [Pandoravirus salinus]
MAMMIEVLPTEIRATILWLLDGVDLLACLCASPCFHVWSHVECDRRRYGGLSVECAIAEHGPDALNHLMRRRRVVFDSGHLLLAVRHNRIANVDWLLQHTDAVDRMGFVGGTLACPCAIADEAASVLGTAPLLRALVERGHTPSATDFASAACADHIEAMDVLFDARPDARWADCVNPAISPRVAAFFLDRCDLSADHLAQIVRAFPTTDVCCGGTAHAAPIDWRRVALNRLYAHDPKKALIVARDDADVARLVGNARISSRAVADVEWRHRRSPSLRVSRDVAKEMTDAICAGAEGTVVEACTRWFVEGGDLGGARVICSMATGYVPRCDHRQHGKCEATLFAIDALDPDIGCRCAWATDAARLGRVRLVGALLDRFATGTTDDCAPYVIAEAADGAAMHCRMDVLGYLDQRGGVDWSRVSLDWAAAAGNTECVRFLYERGARHTTDAVEAMARRGHLDTIQLISGGCMQEHAARALRAAAAYGRMDCVEVLCDTYPDDVDVGSAIEGALGGDHIQVAAFLFDRCRDQWRASCGEAQLAAALQPRLPEEQAVRERVLARCDDSVLRDALVEAMGDGDAVAVGGLVCLADTHDIFDAGVFAAAVQSASLGVLLEMALRTPHLCDRREIESVDWSWDHAHCGMAERARQRILDMLSAAASASSPRSHTPH